MELVHFHVRHTAARPPCHRYAVPRRSPRRGGKDIGAPRPAGREYGRPPYISVDMVGGLVEGIDAPDMRSEEHTSELQSLMRISYAVFCLNKKTNYIKNPRQHTSATIHAKNAHSA